MEKKWNSHLDVLTSADGQAPTLCDGDALGLERDGAVGEGTKRVVGHALGFFWRVGGVGGGAREGEKKEGVSFFGGENKNRKKGRMKQPLASEAVLNSHLDVADRGDVLDAGGRGRGLREARVDLRPESIFIEEEKSGRGRGRGREK